MKKCPYCGAKIEENAKVCLYCMKELQQKEQIAPFFGFIGRRWLIVALVLLLLAGGFFLLHKMNNNPVPQPQEEQAEQATDTVGLESGEKEPEHPMAGENTPSADDPSPKQENGDTTQKENPTSDSQGSDQKGSNPPGKQESPDKEGENKKEDNTTKEEDSTKEDNTGSESGREEPSDPGDEKSDPEPEPDPTPAPTAAVYTWRDAQYGVDDYQVTANVDNCVVITGVSTPASDGIYRIPETLGGKRVIAIKQSAFNGEGIRDTVRAVYLPSSVRTVQANAFSACYNLTDIYFSAKSIYVDPWAFAAKDRRSGTLNIHCAYDCNNRDLRYYRNIAESYYDAQFKEWNG